MAGLHKPLLNEGSPLIMKKEGVPAILFDQASIFALAPHIVDGYLILLGKPEAATGASCKPDGLSDGDLDLQFQALSSGNVLDACFGVQASSPTAASNAKAAKEAKEFLTGLALLPEPKGRQVKRLAVAAYAEAHLKPVEEELRVARHNVAQHLAEVASLRSLGEASAERARTVCHELTRATEELETKRAVKGLKRTWSGDRDKPRGWRLSGQGLETAWRGAGKELVMS